LANASAAKERERDAELTKEANAEQKQKLLEVLSTVWKASAAVVDVALGRERKLDAASETGAVAGVSRVAESDRAQQPGQAGGVAGQGVSEGEPVAYTEQGESAKVPLEQGKFVDQTV
jgi:hypothetical protein